MTESSVGKSEYVYRGWKIRITRTAAAVTFLSKGRGVEARARSS
jgi:hypothetical protein